MTLRRTANELLMIIGIGLDLIDLSRFEALYSGDDPALLKRCFTARELADAGEGLDRLSRLSGRAKLSFRSS